MASSLNSRIASLQLRDDDHCSVGFLDLSLEVRQKIYRCLLLERDAPIESPNPVFEEATHSHPIIAGMHEMHGGPATLQGVNPSIERVDLSIFEVNRQIREEARSFIFSEESHWVSVSINSKGFSNQLREAGFPVFFRRSFSKVIKPALKIKVGIASLNALRQKDNFVVGELATSKLMRALNTIRAKNEVSIFIDIQPIPPLLLSRNRDTDIRSLMCLFGTFEELRGIRKAVVRGIPSCLEDSLEAFGETAATLSETAATLMESSQTLGDLFIFIAGLRNGAKMLCAKQRWAEAEKVYLSILAVLTDFTKTDDTATLAASMLFGGISLNEFPDTCCIISSNLAFVQYKLGNFEGAIKRATYALTAAEAPQKVRAKALYRRGLARYALKDYVCAASDLLDAQSLSPSDLMIERELEKINDRLGEMYPMSANPMEMAKKGHRKKESSEGGGKAGIQARNEAEGGFWWLHCH